MHVIGGMHGMQWPSSMQHLLEEQMHHVLYTAQCPMASCCSLCSVYRSDRIDRIARFQTPLSCQTPWVITGTGAEIAYIEI